MPDDPDSAAPSPGDGPPRRHSAQDRRKAERVEKRRNQFARILADAEGLALFAREGFGEERLTDAVARCDAFQTGYDDRANALVAQDAASKAFQKQDEQTRQAFSDLHGAVLAEYRDPATRRALGVDDDPPYDLEQFIPYALGLLDTLQDEPYATALDKKHGYDAERRAGVRDAVLALRTADTAHLNAVKHAENTTAAREAAYADVMEEADLLDRATPRALRDHPAVRTRLEL